MDDLMTEKEVMAHLRVSRQTLLAMRTAGLIRFIRFGNALRYRRSDIERFLERLSQNKEA